MRRALNLPSLILCLPACGLGLGLSAACTISPVGGLIAACIFTFSVAALRQPVLFGELVILGIALTSGMGRGLIIPYLTPNEAILLYATAAAFPLILMKRPGRGSSARVFTAGTLVLLAGTVLLPWVAYNLRGIRLSGSETSKLLAPLQYVLLFWLFRRLPEDERERHQLIRWMWTCGSMVAAVGLLQAAGVEPVNRFLEESYPSSHTAAAAGAQRATSLLGAWNGLGTFLMLNLLLLRAFRPHLSSRSDRFSAAASVLLCTACLLASGSYAGLAGLAAGYIILEALQPNGRREWILPATGAALGFILLRSSILYRFGYQFEAGEMIPSTLQFRLEVWREVFQPVVQKNWLWGYRPGLEGLAWRWPESQYVYLVLRGGIPALFAHLTWVACGLAWLYRRVAERAGQPRQLAGALIALTIVLSIMGITNEVFTFSGTSDYVWILFGLLAGSEDRHG